MRHGVRERVCAIWSGVSWKPARMVYAAPDLVDDTGSKRFTSPGSA